MKDIHDEFENKLLEVINEYSHKGMGTHDQITTLSYLNFELCNKVFMDVRFGYTHMLTMLMQRIVYDMNEDRENNKDTLH